MTMLVIVVSFWLWAVVVRNTRVKLKSRLDGFHVRTKVVSFWFNCSIFWQGVLLWWLYFWKGIIDEALFWASWLPMMLLLGALAAVITGELAIVIARRWQRSIDQDEDRRRRF